MITLMLRLGFRRVEVASLKLDDIDWRAGELTVCGKGNRIERMPLPTDVGAAIAAYLHDGRPPTAESRSVFVRFRAPHQPLSTSGVSSVVTHAAGRAGLGCVRAPKTSPSAATEMVRAGATLPQGRAGPASSASVEHRHLRQGRYRVLAGTGPPPGRLAVSHEHPAPRAGRLPGSAPVPGLPVERRRNCSTSSLITSISTTHRQSPARWRWGGPSCPAAPIRCGGPPASAWCGGSRGTCTPSTMPTRSPPLMCCHGNRSAPTHFCIPTPRSPR